jgi:hypothetical protein
MSYDISFYEFPNNVVNGAAIPLSQVVVPLAALTIETQTFSRILLRGSFGWVALSNKQGVNEVSVLFKIWRGAPNTGTLIYSIRDSSESWADRNKMTSFAHVDSGFSESKNITYTFTAELPSGGSANVIGSMLLSASDVVDPQ